MSKTTSLSNKALVISGIDKIDYRPWPLELEVVDDKPLVPEGQVLVRVKASGICGSDVSHDPRPRYPGGYMNFFDTRTIQLLTMAFIVRPG